MNMLLYKLVHLLAFLCQEFRIPAFGMRLLGTRRDPHWVLLVVTVEWDFRYFTSCFSHSPSKVLHSDHITPEKRSGVLFDISLFQHRVTILWHFQHLDKSKEISLQRQCMMRESPLALETLNGGLLWTICSHLRHFELSSATGTD